MTMATITFLGAGSTVFARNILGDVMVTPALRDSDIRLYDIDGERLEESKLLLDNLNKNINGDAAGISTFLGPQERKNALRGADYVVNAVQVGGYKPSTVIDFEIPKKYGLRQTIGDTAGIGGIFRGLRTIPVLLDFARDIEEVCPHAWFLNYSNPMSILTGAMLRGTGVKTVGLCHSYQVCAESLLASMGMNDLYKTAQWKIAGINHMAWLLEITSGGKDLYPEIKKKAKELLDIIIKKGGGKKDEEEIKAALEKDISRFGEFKEIVATSDMVRLTMMLKMGYYITESSEHNAEYTPYWIKSAYPHLVDRYNIPLDEYPRRCVEQIAGWKKQKEELLLDKNMTHSRSLEYGSYIMEAVETGVPAMIGGNVRNNGMITNLPAEAVVEIPCLVDRNGVQGTFVGPLPEQCAALNRTNINVHLLAIKAALEKKREHIYHAAMLDPHTAAELSIDDICKMCDELIEAHGEYLPKYK
jgi:alpha-galactosidase